MAVTRSEDYLYIKPFTGIQSSSGAWYQTIKFLGKGGNGISYLVLCTGGKYLGCIFTLKILYRISKPERIKKFLNEVAFVKDCSFPTILKQYDDGEWHNYPFVIMDYMSTTLEAMIKKGLIRYTAQPKANRNAGGSINYHLHMIPQLLFDESFQNIYLQTHDLHSK